MDACVLSASLQARLALGCPVIRANARAHIRVLQPPPGRIIGQARAWAWVGTTGRPAWQPAARSSAPWRQRVGTGAPAPLQVCTHAAPCPICSRRGLSKHMVPWEKRVHALTRLEPESFGPTSASER